MENKPRNFREYGVWKDAVELSTFVYQQTDSMPWFEKNTEDIYKVILNKVQHIEVQITRLANSVRTKSDIVKP